MMRFKKTNHSSVPEVNLVPMMDVLMSVMTFFIITSMTLTGQRLGNIELPGSSVGGIKQQELDTLIVGLNKEGRILIEGQAIDEAELARQIQSYLAEHSQGTVILKADRELSYQKVSALLKKMAKIGGDRVSLAVQKQS
ncbi:MAG: biopolymer transporter ExbD [Cyanobacteriota bacterium]|nr:biopolymer transporter ExbD [Cyanobacteriota bacterium]